MNPAPFFDYMRERYSIHLKRKAGLPGPWTDDYILQQFRFCNVFREDDRTTIWFRENVRERVDPRHIILATVLFRWFNRIKTGEAIFQQESLGLGGEEPGETAWDAFVRMGDVSVLRAAILQYCGSGPYVTGSYIIKTPDGMDKLEGVLQCVRWFMQERRVFPVGSLGHLEGWRDATDRLLLYSGSVSLEDVWNWLRQFPYLGDFMSYEVVTDLRHTPLLDKAPDIHTWANPGPGAMRGLNRLNGRDLKFRMKKSGFIEEMRTLLAISEDRELWPGEYPSLEMRDIEHTLCEYDKIERVRNGQGTPRQRFR